MRTKRRARRAERRLVVAAALTVAASGCDPAASGDPTPSARATAGFVVDDAGDTLDASTPRMRVVSMIPAVTDLLVHMGAADRLVARTRYDSSPSLAHLPSVGGGIDPDMETLATLQPDLVVAWLDADARSAAGQASTLGIPAYQAEYQTMADVRRHARDLGRLLGLSEAADSVVETVDARFSRVRERVAGAADRPTVLYVVSEEPPFVAGAGTFVDSLIWTAGGVNAVADVRGWPQVSFETLVERGPEVILLPTSGGADQTLARLRASPGWAQLPAVRTGRVVPVDPDLFGRPGPGLAEAAELLVEALHPGLR